MKEYLTRKVRFEEVDEFIKTEEIFLWKLVSKDESGFKVRLTFERETEEPYYKETVQKEKIWKKKMETNMVPIYVLTALAMVLITAALIVRLLLGNEGVYQILVYSFLFGGIGVFLVASLIFLLLLRKGQKNIMNFYELRHQLKEELDQIRNGNKEG